MPSSDTRVITFVYSCALTHKATKELHKVLVNVTGESERKRVQDDEKQWKGKKIMRPCQNIILGKRQRHYVKNNDCLHA